MYNLYLLNDWTGTSEGSEYKHKKGLIGQHISKFVADKHLARCCRDFPEGKYVLKEED